MSKLDFLEKYAVEGRHYDIEKEIDKLLDHPDGEVRWKAIQHPNATEEHITKALSDQNIGVRAIAIEHPNVTKEHIEKALNDSE